MLSKIKENYLSVFSWLILLLSIIIMYSNFTENNFNFFINSDSLGLPSFYKDIIYDNGDFKNWYWASAPNLFPDAILFGFVSFILRENIVTVAFVYALIQISAIVAMLIYIYKKIVNENFKKFSWLIPVFFTLFFIEAYYFSHDLSFGFYLLTYSFHIGPFVNCLITLTLFFSSIRNSLKYLLIGVICLIGSFSDKLYIVMLIAPLVISLLLTIRKENIKRTFSLIVILALSCFIGLYIYDYIGEEKLIIFTSPHKMYSFDDIEPSAALFLEQMINYIKILGFRSLQIIFTFLSIFLCAIYYLKNRKTANKNLLFFIMFYVVFCFGTFLAPIINGNYSGYDTLRYNIYPFYLSSIIFTLTIVYFLSKVKSEVSQKGFALSILSMLFIFTIIKFDSKGLDNYLNYYPESVSQIDSVAKKYHLKKGLSEYWTAKRTSLLSKEQVKILSVYNDISMQELGTNIDWFYTGQFDFVIADNLKPESITSRFKIRDTIQTKHHTILIVDKYYFPRGKYFPENVNP